METIFFSETSVDYHRTTCQNQSYFTTGCLQPISSYWRQAPWHSSLTRKWVCSLQLLLSLPAQSFSGPTATGLMTIFYCLKFETLPTWRARSPYLYPPGTGWPGYTPRHWVPFPSPLTTTKATVEISEPASRTTWRYIPQRRTLQDYRCENLKSYNRFLV
jgi:hypothetical protein